MNDGFVADVNQEMATGGQYGMDQGEDVLDICLDEEDGHDGPPAGFRDEESEHAEDDRDKRHPAETREVRTKPFPMRPSSEEVAKHYATHYPYRNWCPVCVAASAKEDPHPRKSSVDDETGLRVIAMDYEILERDLTVLIAKDVSSGAVLAYDCERKGSGDQWLVKQLARDLDDWGEGDVCLKADSEPSMIALQAAIATAKTGSTVLRNPHAYNPQYNVVAEKARQVVMDVLTRLLLGLEAKPKMKVDVNLPIANWIARHAAFALTRY